jgi:hypothetical protein
MAAYKSLSCTLRRYAQNSSPGTLVGFTRRENHRVSAERDHACFVGFDVSQRSLRLRKTKPRRPLPYIIGPNGNVLTIADLPPAQTTRWVKRRKAEVVAAVHGELISLEEACRRYALTVEEFSSWERAVKKELASKRETTTSRSRQKRNQRSGRQKAHNSAEPVSIVYCAASRG